MKINGNTFFAIFLGFIFLIAIYAGQETRIKMEPICKKYNGKMLNNTNCIIKENGEIKKYNSTTLFRKDKYETLLNNK